MTRLSLALRRAVRQRARERCEYCQSSTLLTGEEFTADHIVPTARGGADALDNLCYCCFWCFAPGCPRAYLHSRYALD